MNGDDTIRLDAQFAYELLPLMCNETSLLVCEHISHLQVVWTFLFKIWAEIMRTIWVDAILL